MDEQGCPRCKTTKYRNPSLKLMVNVCGHTLCESCVDVLFIKGSGKCQECGVALRRTNFRVQVFEDAFVEKEVDIRKRVLRDFNKREEEFSSLREYNDYLELVETIVFNLSNNIDVDSTKRQIEQYKKDNKEQIMKNKSKQTKEEEFLEMMVEQEQQEMEMRKSVQMEEEMSMVKEKERKQKNKNALIEDLMYSNMSADRILESHKEMTRVQEERAAEVKPASTMFSTGIRFGHQDPFKPTPMEESELYNYVEYVIDTDGPSIPNEKDLLSCGYLSHVRSETPEERGGGYKARFACQRALFDAFGGLFDFSTSSDDRVT